MNNAFLQRHLFETLFMQQPPGFLDQDHPTYVYKLQKVIYGLKQTPWAWYHELHTFFLQSSFKNYHANTSLFVLTTTGHIIYLLIYMDDPIIIGDSTESVDSCVATLAH
jgi:histone deacetylase 1/2